MAPLPAPGSPPRAFMRPPAPPSTAGTSSVGEEEEQEEEEEVEEEEEEDEAGEQEGEGAGGEGEGRLGQPLLGGVGKRAGKPWHKRSLYNWAMRTWRKVMMVEGEAMK